MRSDRSSNRVDAGHDDVPGQQADPRHFVDGSLASEARRPTHYLTTARLSAIEASLTAGDWTVLEIVRSFGFVSGPQLAALCFGVEDREARAARRALGRLRDLGVLDVLERRIGGVRAGSSGLVYRLGHAGVRLLDHGQRRHGEPGQHHLRHTLAIVEVLVTLKKAERSGRLMVLRFDAEPTCWRSFTGRYGEPVVLKPDAYVELRIGTNRRLWFVEVDRGTVSTTTLKTKLARYSDYFDTGIEQSERHGTFPRVVWITHTDRRRRHLADLCDRENHRIGAELHRLIEQEWQPPPAERAQPPTSTNPPERR